MRTPFDLLGSDRPDRIHDARALLERARAERIHYFPSPADWRDEILYFLLPDRFSDAKEDGRPLLTREEIRQLRDPHRSRPDLSWQAWARSGLRWQGGTLRGIQGRLPYLQGLGITAIWIGPLFKQRARLDSYHGYGVQDFLEVDPRFGTRRELIELVAAAHAAGIRVILDVVVNHSGDNWGYAPSAAAAAAAVNEPPYRPFPDFYGNANHPALRDQRVAWRDEQQVPFTTDAAQLQWPHDAVWPRELQDPAHYTRAGKGELGAGDVGDEHAEHKRTDFFALKDFALDGPGTLALLADCFKYWIALSDCDGFRIDTVKHLALEDARNFCGAIREFTESLGKRNFLLVGEIAGGDFFQDFVLDNLAILERNLDAALDIGSARLQLQDVAKGLIAGAAYLDGFKAQSEGFESHRSFGDRHVSILDDHDHVFGEKVRFSAQIPDASSVKDYQVVVATALQLFTLGIPCIYYGTEQAFAGPAQSQLPFLLAEGWQDGGRSGDRFLREAMFGPKHPRADFHGDLATQVQDLDVSLPGFGPFGTSDRHCFDTESPAYVRIAALCRVRSEQLVLRVGRQYPRQIRILDDGFRLPAAGELVAWSRILDTQEALCVVNPNGGEGAARGGDVIVSSELWAPGTLFTVVANTAETAARAQAKPYFDSHPIGSTLAVRGRRTRRSRPISSCGTSSRPRSWCW